MIKYFTGNEGNRNSAGILLYGLIIQESVKQQAVTIGVTATAIPTTALTRRKSMWIFNNASNVVYIGASDVSTANGFPIYPRAVVNVQIEDGITLYGISAAGGDELRIIEGS